MVNATGTVNPVRVIRVGCFASGPVVKLHVDFNTKVTKDAVLAEIDPQVSESMKTRDEAAVAIAKADVMRLEALLQQAVNEEQRAKKLQERDPGFLTETEMDRCRYSRLALEAQVLLAEAQVDQAKANLENSVTNLSYTKIRSPVDGVIIDRKIDEGQTLAVQFQIPDLFLVAPDLEKEIYVHASVDEADVGLVGDAQRRDEPVLFTVDSHPDDLFEGRISQIRMNPITKENVVTYTVIVSSPNPELKLLPGMTAKLSFQIDKKTDILKVSNAALRFFPKIQHVRVEDRPLIEGTELEEVDRTGTDRTADNRSSLQRITDHRDSSRRHVWVVDGLELRAIEITTGLSDYRHTEVIKGELKAGMPLVTGVK